jgi:predicted pyridoxine 5'-phosphate oxidase superfamily flavin-nucleotide-binding protein
VATITTDPQLLGLGAVNGRLPRTALDITAREVLYQCPRALVRSGLWDGATQVDPAALPSLDEVLAAQVDDLSLEESLRIGRASVADPLW